MVQSVDLEPWIETFTGKRFEFLNPQYDQIDIRDIAHSLAFTCRYTGHSRRFYSVAEHSIFVSYLAADPLAGLLHDASEAYITDIASPIKPHLHNYKELEDMIMDRIATKFGFPYPLSSDVKDCDNTQLKTEAKHLLKSAGLPWASKYITKREHGIKPQCMGPEEAEQVFLERFEEVRNVWPVDDKFTFKDFNLCRNPSGLYSPSGYQSSQLHGGQVRVEGATGPCSSYDKDSRSQYVRCEDPDTSPCETEVPARERP